MKTEYRIIFTAAFDTAAERDKAYGVLKTFVTSDAMTKVALFKRADMTPDEYSIQERPAVSEKVI